MNPNTDDDVQQWRGDITLEWATVETVPTHDGGSDGAHAVEITLDWFDEPEKAEVAIGLTGDVLMPEEGDRVIVGYREDERPIVLGGRYLLGDSIPAFQAGERVVGHPASDSHVRFHADGTLTVSGDGGNTVELQSDGSVVINGGSTAPVTDVTVSTTTDSDGHVTSVSLTKTRGADVYLPSN